MLPDKLALFVRQRPCSIKKKLSQLGLLNKRIKVYSKGNFYFLYNDKNEIPAKVEYCQFWREVTKNYVIDESESRRNKTAV